MPIDPSKVSWDPIDPSQVQWDGPAPPKKKDSMSFGSELAASIPAQAIMGAVRGAGSIGATILTPIDAAARALGIENSVIGRRDRRKAMTEALKEFGADPSSLAFQGGKLGAEIAGTAGVPGMLAKGALAIRAPAALVQALRTGGMSSGIGGAKGLAARVAGGAATGAATAGLVNPEDAGMGAVIGGGLPVIGAAVKKGAELGRSMIGQTTGAGDEALRQAYVTGKSGGNAGEAFRKSLRGESQIDDVLEAAKQNMQSMRQQKQQAYRSGMVDIKADKSVLKFSEIDNAVKSANEMATFKGQIKAPKAANAVKQAQQEIAKWKKLDPAEYHTPEGMDALKQRVGDILEGIPFEQKQARTAVSGIYNSIKDSIKNQAPSYDKVMKEYSDASQLMGEIERSLSLGQKSSADTAMRKLQSLMRNNANTNYGYRQQLAESMQEAGGRQIMPQLAGQALNDWTPRGIQRAAAGTGGAALALTGNAPAAAGLAAISSPRLMGEVFHGAGRLAGSVDPRIIQALRSGTYRALPVAPAD